MKRTSPIFISILLCFLFIPFQQYGQKHTSLVYTSYLNPPEVKAYSKTKTLAWAGGLNNPQFARADLNNDGTKDMVVFDPDNGVRTFLNISPLKGNPNYVYKPEYASNFPTMYSYMKLLDYNRDDVPDLFCRLFTHCEVYPGYYNASGQLSFKNNIGVKYKYDNSGNTTSIYVSTIEIPSIVDIDGDGDLDFFSFDQLTGSHIDFYKNWQVEKGLPKDTIKLTMNDRCWGRIRDNAQKKWDIGYSCIQYGLTSYKTTKTTDPGNNMCMLDYDGDGDYDFFNGSNVWYDIQLFYNGKNLYGKDSIIAEDTLWGSNGKTLKLTTWPMVFWLDVDNDNDSDLVFAPKSENTQNYKNVVLYKNEGTHTSPNYVYQSDSFFVSEMIDAGTGSQPFFYDYNKDGKIDLFVGSEGYYQQSTNSMISGISYYENVSTGGATKFELKNNDFLNLYATQTKGTHIAVGDIDMDGKDDLLIGKLNGTVEYYQNTAASAIVQPIWQFRYLLNDLSGQMDVGDYATPFIYDINKDGKNDIVSGNQMGRLIYYKNIGTAGTPSFQKITDSLGGVVINERTFYTYTSPFIGKIDNTGKEYLMIGTKAGIIYRYDSLLPTNLTKYVRLDSNYSYINVFNRATLAIAQVDTDSKYVMAVGCNTGGIHLFKQYYNAGISDNILSSMNVKVYPNPANSSITVKWDAKLSEDMDINIFSILGKKEIRLYIQKDQQETTINTSSLAPGTYYCHIQSGNSRVVLPVTIIR